MSPERFKMKRYDLDRRMLLIISYCDSAQQAVRFDKRTCRMENVLFPNVNRILER